MVGFIIWAWGSSALAQTPILTLELDTDRPGEDYSSFELDRPNPQICRSRCAKDVQCRAYTYVKPGVQGPKARCWLKTTAPAAARNSCCISGVKTGGPPPPEPAPSEVRAAPDPNAAWLGVFVSPLNREAAGLRGYDGVGGILVNASTPAGPAAAAYLRTGDIVMAVAGEPMAEPARLIELIEARKPGESIEIQVFRDGHVETLNARLASRADAARLIQGDAERERQFQQALDAHEAGSYGLALSYYTQLALHGVTAARHNLGVLFENGQGVNKDLKRAAYWFRQAAEAEHAPAQHALGLYYRDGRGVPADKLRAYYWLNQAVENGAADAEAARDHVTRELTVGEVAEAERLGDVLDRPPVLTARTPPTPEPEEPERSVESPPAPAATLSRDEARDLQRLLTALGYDPGPADGLPGRRTQAAIRQFQTDQGLASEGQPTPGILAKLREIAELRGVGAPPPAVVQDAVPDSDPEDDLGNLEAFDDF